VAVAAALMIWPLWQPLLLAAWFAVFARPLVNVATRITGGKRRAAAVLTVLLLLLVLFTVVYMRLVYGGVSVEARP
jgi:predicted PurR-regulated permease PerM